MELPYLKTTISHKILIFILALLSSSSIYWHMISGQKYFRDLPEFRNNQPDVKWNRYEAWKKKDVRESRATYYPTHLIPPCDSKIFCYGKFLENNYLTKLFEVETDFLHLKLKRDQDIILNDFESAFLNSTNFDARYKLFVNRYFEVLPIRQPTINLPGGRNITVNVTAEMDIWMPEDWNPNPSFIDKIIDPELREWAWQLHNEWLILGRKISPNVRYNQGLYTLIYMPQGFFLPSSRDTEMHYFENYLIIRAMLSANMSSTAKGIINNLLTLHDRNHMFSIIPRGNRIYYLGYGSLPLIIPMVYEYWKATNDTNFVISVLAQLEDDMRYWKRESKTVTVNQLGKISSLHVYNVYPNTPRPISYYHDYELGEKLQSNLSEFYTNLGSMTESNWDPSSRWISSSTPTNELLWPKYLKPSWPQTSNGLPIDPYDEESDNSETQSELMQHVKTIDVAPVDLNAIICLNHRYLAEMYESAGVEYQAMQHRRHHASMINAIHELWDEESGSWFDMDVNKRVSFTRNWYASNLMPFYADCLDRDSIIVLNGDNPSDESKGMQDIDEQILRYFKNEKLDTYASGIPLSKNQSGFGWDMPYTNAFYMMTIIEAFAKSQSQSMRNLAYSLASNWIHQQMRDHPTKTTINGIENAAILLLLERYAEDMRAPNTMQVSGSHKVLMPIALLIILNSFLILLCIKHF